MNILDIAIAKKLAGGGGGSGTDNYNDLSNLPKINDTTLSGNKSSSALGLQSEINSDSKLASDLVDDANHTNKFVTSTEKQTWNAKQNAIDADHKLSSSLVSFTTAEAAALASGIDSSKVGQISTNQTNILYTLGKTGKNIFDFDAWVDGLTVTRGTFTISGNSITITATENDCSTDRWNPSSSVSPVFKIPTKAGEVIILQWNADLSQASNGGTVYVFPNGSPASPVWTYASSTKITFTVPSGCEFITFRFGVARSGETITYSNIMVCTQEDWNVSPDYQPYRGLPNYDLTRLESEDRAALAEQVDKGAKNRFDEWNEIYKINKQYATSDNTISMNDVTFTYADDSITVSGTASSDVYFFVLTDSMQLSNENLVVAWRSKTVNTMSLYVKYLGIDPIETTNSVLELPYRTDSASMAIHIPSGTQVSGTIDLMICTEEEFKISPTYQPYALPNTDLTQEVNALHEKTNRMQPVVGFAADAPGWYRVFTLGSVSATSIAVGAYDNSCDIVIKRMYAKTNNEHHEIKLGSIFQSMEFTDEYSKSAVLLITKIRYVATDDNAYIDIYYSGSALNIMYCFANNNVGEATWKAVNTVVKVPETATGETVWASYDFNVNYDLPRIIKKHVNVQLSTTETIVSDLTFTLPASKGARVSIAQSFDNAAPATIRIATANDMSDAATLGYTTTSTAYGELSLVSLIKPFGLDRTIYISCATLTATGNNDVYMIIELFDI